MVYISIDKMFTKITAGILRDVSNEYQQNLFSCRKEKNINIFG